MMKLLKFEAEWCGTCDQQDSLLEDYDATTVEHIDVDEDMERANEYGVRGLPALVLVEDDGTPLKQWSGVTRPDEIESAVESYK